MTAVYYNVNEHYEVRNVRIETADIEWRPVERY